MTIWGTGEAEEVQRDRDASDTGNERAQMDLGSHQLCKLLPGLMFLCALVPSEKMGGNDIYFAEL